MEGPQIIDWIKKTPEFLMVGLVLLVIGMSGSNVLYSMCTQLGITIMLLWLAVRIYRTLPKDEIIDHWDGLIDEGAGMGDELMQDVHKRINETKAPFICLERNELAPSFIDGIFGDHKPFLIISHTDNCQLRPFKMYINAEDYGTKLSVNWYLAHHRTLWQQISDYASQMPILEYLFQPDESDKPKKTKAESLSEIGLFDEQELRAFVTNAHRCLLEAVKELGAEHDLDTSGVGNCSKGFMGIS